MSHCDCSVCQSGLPTEEAIQRVMSSILDHIDEIGHSVMGVFGDETEPAFAYTIGLLRQDRPELVVVGVDPRIGHGILNSAAALDQPLEVGREYDKVVVGYKVRIAEPSPEVIEAMTLSQSYNAQFGEGTPFRALQIVWPDPQGRYPGDPGYDAAYYRQMIPVLGESVQ